MQRTQLIPRHALLEHPCMEHPANAVMHSLNQLHILALLVVIFLEQHA